MVLVGEGPCVDLHYSGVSPFIPAHSALTTPSIPGLAATVSSRAAVYLAEMRDVGVHPTVGVYNTMLQMHQRSADKGSHGRLETLYSDMREAGVCPDDATLAVLAASCARAGRCHLPPPSRPE